MDALGGIVLVIAVNGGVTMGSASVGLAVLHQSEVGDPRRYHDPTGRMGNAATALIGIVAGVLLWAVWISWGDFAYPTWAIVGCVISSLLVTLCLGFLSRWRLTGPFVGAVGGLLGFSSACAVQMGLDDYVGAPVPGLGTL